uniref:Uncharacterized protein n=1 Tax=Anguilla anguilla TaxID=7936 RepID=A0A0E9TGN3_ANGAN
MQLTPACKVPVPLLFKLGQVKEQHIFLPYRVM